MMTYGWFSSTSGEYEYVCVNGVFFDRATEDINDGRTLVCRHESRDQRAFIQCARDDASDSPN
jgi:hypothetical protein